MPTSSISSFICFATQHRRAKKRNVWPNVDEGSSKPTPLDTPVRPERLEEGLDDTAVPLSAPDMSVVALSESGSDPDEVSPSSPYDMHGDTTSFASAESLQPASPPHTPHAASKQPCVSPSSAEANLSGDLVAVSSVTTSPDSDARLSGCSDMCELPMGKAEHSPTSHASECFSFDGHASESVSDSNDSFDSGDHMRFSNYMMLYAAATQHVAGVKIATPDSVSRMDVTGLHQMRMALKELIASRNDKLVQALAEREMWHHEIEFKKSLLTPLVIKAQAAADAMAEEAPAVHPSVAVVPVPSGQGWGLGKLFRRTTAQKIES